MTLLLEARVHDWLEQEHVVGLCEVDAHSSRSDAQQEDRRGRVVPEGQQRLLALHTFQKRSNHFT